MEDSKRLRETLFQGLTRQGFAVDSATDGIEAMELLEAFRYDVMLLDLMIPQLDGYSLLRRLRAQGDDTFTLVVSARNQLENRLEALKSGADDFIAKPFSFEELVARIDALVRRKYGQKSPLIQVGPIALNTSLKTAKVKGQTLDLTKLEYRILELLAHSRGQINTRETIIEHVYSSDDVAASNVIDVHICSLRRKLAAYVQGPVVHTKKGFGYYIAESTK